MSFGEELPINNLLLMLFLEATKTMKRMSQVFHKSPTIFDMNIYPLVLMLSRYGIQLLNSLFDRFTTVNNFDPQSVYPPSKMITEMKTDINYKSSYLSNFYFQVFSVKP